MAPGVVLALARAELRRSWIALVAIGVLAGIAAGVALGSFGLARRTMSAPDRLAAATRLDDARVTFFDGGDAAARISGLPVVRAAWTAETAVGQVEGAGRQFASISFGPPRPQELFSPVVVAGRAPDPSAPHEVLVTEALAENLGLEPGGVLTLRMLLAREVFQFDTGFGEPDGPELDLTVSGLVRLTSQGGDGFGPVFGTPAFAEKYGSLSAGSTLLMRLEPGEGSRAVLEQELEEITAATDPRAAEFGPLQASYPTDVITPQVGAARRVLGGGLLLFAFIAGAAGVLVTVQALTRHAASRAGDQRIEAALGVVRAERVAGRLLPALAAILPAAGLAAAGVMAAGAVQPLGSLRGYEPHPGWLPDLAVAGWGALVTGLVVALLVVATVVVAERRARPRGTGATGRAVARWWRRPTTLLGASLAFGGRGSGSRGTVLTAILAVAGVVATATFAASLDRLERTPAYYGWTADFGIADVKPAELEEFLADERLRDVRVAREAAVRIDGALTEAQAYTDHKGGVATTVIEGRLPRTRSEIALGEAVSRSLGAGPGDVVPLGPDRAAAAVTGVVVVPPTSAEQRLGAVVLLTPEGLDAVAESMPWTTALVNTRPGEDAEAIRAEYNERLETLAPEPPGEVRNLLDLGALPLVLEVFLAALAFTALAHAVAQVLRRRRRDLAVVRALGLTPRQVAGALVAMAAAIAAGGVIVGTPLGLALGRLAWGETAGAAGIVPDAALPWGVLIGLVPLALALACVVALVPAWRAARLGPAQALREE